MDEEASKKQREKRAIPKRIENIFTLGLLGFSKSENSSQIPAIIKNKNKAANVNWFINTRVITPAPKAKPVTNRDLRFFNVFCFY